MSPAAGFDPTLLSRIEDAGLNASAPPQQRWIDGWLLRYCPGKARRARCVQAVATGRLSNAERLALCEAVLDEAGLPLFVRITPFSQPPGLNDWLLDQGLHALDDTQVMVTTTLPDANTPPPIGTQLVPTNAEHYADAVGDLRGSTATQRAAHAHRMAHSPIPYRGWLLQRIDDHQVLACAQTAAEADMVGVYDVFTAPAARGQRLAGWLCATLLAQAASAGARVAYLQVDAANTAARQVYRRLGFANAYGYHYVARDPRAT